jgi:hypothetical protein
MTAKAHDVPSSAVTDAATLSLDDLYHRYVQYINESAQEIMALLSTEDRRACFRSAYVPLPRATFEHRVTTMDPVRREQFEAKLRDGYQVTKQGLSDGLRCRLRQVVSEQ